MRSDPDQVEHCVWKQATRQSMVGTRAFRTCLAIGKAFTVRHPLLLGDKLGSKTRPTRILITKTDKAQIVPRKTYVKSYSYIDTHLQSAAYALSDRLFPGFMRLACLKNLFEPAIERS